MENLNSIVDKITQGQDVPPSLLSLKASFLAKRMDLAKDFLGYELVQQEILFNLDSLEKEDHILSFILKTLPNSELYFQIKNDYIHLERVWEAIVDLEQIPVSVEGIYITGDNHLLIKQDNLKEADVVLENKDHPVISSLNFLNTKEEFKFQAKLQKGSLFTYAGNIILDEYDKKLNQIKNQEMQAQGVHNQFKNLIKGATGIGLALGMSFMMTSCGKNPNDNDYKSPNHYTEIPFNNSEDCQIRRSRMYNNLNKLSQGMTERQVDQTINPDDHYSEGYFKYSKSYEIIGMDPNERPNTVVCEVIQVHFDFNWKFQSFNVRTYRL